jgi:hypothetical protein
MGDAFGVRIRYVGQLVLEWVSHLSDLPGPKGVYLINKKIRPSKTKRVLVLWRHMESGGIVKTIAAAANQIE